MTALWASLCLLAANAQTVTQTMYVDFGEPNVSTRGNKTEGADVNGHYWNNVVSSGNNYLYPGTTFSLVNSSNVDTGYQILVNVRFTTNGMSGGGGLTSPSADLLGDMAIATATQDYIFLEANQHHNFITFKGLDPQKGYRFYTFGSRVVTQDRSATLLFQGENSWSGFMQMSGTGIGDGGYNGNNNKILVSDVVFPDKDGNIRLTVEKTAVDRMAHINAMKIEEISGLERPNQNYKLKQKMFLDVGENNNSRGHQTTGADVNGNYWNNLVSAQSGTDYIIAKGTKIDMVNSSNESTGYQAEMATVMYTNGCSAGGLNNPTVDNLGDLAVTTATEDYVFLAVDGKRQIKFEGLNKNNAYKFYIFGSRATTDTRHSLYTLNGQTTWSTVMATSGSDIGGKGVTGNVRNVAISDYLFPDADGNILFTLERYNSTGYGHFNIIKIEEYEGAERPSDAIQLKSLVLSGTASENGADVSMHRIGTSTSYEGYLRMQPGTYILKGVTTGDASVTLGSGTVSGSVAVDGTPFTSEATQVVRVKYDASGNTLSVVPVELYVKGNVVDNGTKIDYAGNGTWKSTVDMTSGDVFLFSDKYFYFAFNNDDALAVKRLAGSRTGMAMPSEGFSTENIRINRGSYTLGLDMNNYVWTVEAPIDEYKISVFGSSVANGQGATGNQGYAYRYGELLESRYSGSLSENAFYTSGVSIGGNTTVDLLNRYDEMIHDFGRYVIFGLSLGNEGIHGAANQQAIFNQFRDNLQTLIAKARADGKIPVVMNNYTRGDYVTSDYNYVKQMNLLIHEWDMPSVNMLGAIDDGTGKWASGYQSDTYHPTTDGHIEFEYAIPPSLFDALKEGKALPIRDMTGEMTLTGKSRLKFAGENVVHPFAVSVRFKGGDAGDLLNIFTNSNTTASVKIDAEGHVVYTSANGDVIKSSTAVNDNEWHAVTLTQYYAQKRTLLYVDKDSVGEIKAYRITPASFVVGDSVNSVSRTLSELTFWRSALNVGEVAAVIDGKMLKSSLEIYAPLSEKSKENVVNRAQTMNTVEYVDGATVGIGKISSDIGSNAKSAYNLSGMRVGNSYKGVVIRNGRKSVNK
jgi:hypothetical protein